MSVAVHRSTTLPPREPDEVAVRPDDLLAGGLGAEERLARVRAADDRVRRRPGCPRRPCTSCRARSCRSGIARAERRLDREHGVEVARAPARGCGRRTRPRRRARRPRRRRRSRAPRRSGARIARFSSGEPGAPPELEAVGPQVGSPPAATAPGPTMGSAPICLHHPDHVELAPALGDEAVLDAVDPDRGDRDRLAARRDAVELGLPACRTRCCGSRPCRPRRSGRRSPCGRPGTRCATS